MAHPRRTSARPLGDGRYAIWTSFENKDRCKALPGARWEPSMKCWTVPIELTDEADRLVDELNGDGFDALTHALTTLRDVLPESLKVPVFRSLAKVLHPDRGGDTASMQALTNAWEVGR